MTPASPPLFELLQRKVVTPSSGKRVTDCFFQLSFVEQQAYLTLVDQQGEKIVLEERNYEGPIGI